MKTRAATSARVMKEGRKTVMLLYVLHTCMGLTLTTDISDDTRQNVGVPSRRILADIPERAATAHLALAGMGRLTVLRYLLANPGSTKQQLTAGTGMSLNAARAPLEELEALGYISADVDEPRNGKVVHYSAHRSRLTDDLSAFLAWTLR